MRNSLIDNKMLILYLEEIFRKLNELNISLQNQDMNIVSAKQIIKAFMNKLVILKKKATKSTTSVIFPVWMACKVIVRYKQLL